MVIFLLTLSVLSISSELRAQQYPLGLQVGQILDPIICQNDSLHSYALYLPSNYTPLKKWPIIYAFDPVARGRAPLELLQLGAEKYGYIVVGSNNSRNGPWEPVFATVNAVSDDTQERLSINPQRMYTTGFSGGSKVASTVALLSGNIAGVIGCGAGFSGQYPVNPTMDIVYVALAGRGDMNYLEMHSLTTILTVYKIPNVTYLFAGGHRWPPADIFLKAIEWLEVQAMTKGIAPPNDSLISTLFEKSLASAQDLERANQPYRAFKSYSGIATDFENLYDVRDARAKAEQLKNRKAVRQQEKSRKNLLKEEDRLRREFFKVLNSSDLEFYRRKGELQRGGWWKKAVKKLMERIAATSNEDERWMLNRVLDSVWRFCAEQSSLFFEQNGLLQATVYVEIWNILQPDRVGPAYALAAAYAAGGKSQKALAALNRAVANGFNSPRRLEAEQAFDDLKETDGFKQIMARLQAINGVP